MPDEPAGIAGAEGTGSGKEILLAGVFILGTFHDVLGFIDELPDIAELAIHGSESHIGNGIDPAKVLHNRLADGLAGNFPLVGARCLLFHGIHDFCDVFRGNRPFVAGLLHTRQDAVAIEWDARAIFFDHLKTNGLFNALIRGVTPIALFADAPSPDRLPIFDGTRVDDSIFVVDVTEWTAHGSSGKE